MTNTLVNLTLSIDVPNADASDLDDAVRSLRGEIDDLGVESVELIKTPQNVAGAKGVDVVTWGSLAVAVVPHLIPSLLEYLRDWTGRGSRAVHLTTVVDGRQVAIRIDPGAIHKGSLGTILRELGVLTEGATK